VLVGALTWLAVAVPYGKVGPSHPSSPLTALPRTDLRWVWSGALGTDGFTVSAGIDRAAGDAPVRLLLGRVGAGQPAGPAGRLLSDIATPDGRAVQVRVDGLAPDTEYTYDVEIGGVVDVNRRGRVRTAPVGAASFTFAVASCARTDSNGAVFDAITRRDPLFMLTTGDMFYADIGRDDPAAFARIYERTLTAPAQQAMRLRTPVAYVWDDHDFADNNADGTSPARPASRAAFSTYVPHYPFADARSDGTINQAFTVGRVRFVLTDLRSARDPSGQPDGPDKSMLGAAQRDWLVAELRQAARTHALVVWASTVPYATPTTPGEDDWGGYAVERARIADVLAEPDLRGRVLVLSGDAHMLAADDGTNTAFATATSGTGATTGTPARGVAAAARRAGRSPWARSPGAGSSARCGSTTSVRRPWASR
jgi:phosphodiesterase/alkaline phosphatase D-like protein